MPNRPARMLTFLNENTNNYWPPSIEQDPSPPAMNPADKSHWEDVVWSLQSCAPHLSNSFVCNADWWTRRWGTPEAHMFKYILLRGVDDIRFIFSTSEAPPVADVRRQIRTANEDAEVVWQTPGRMRVDRMVECKAILSPALGAVPSSLDGAKIPESLASRLDRIFAASYAGGWAMIGRAEDEAYANQSRYAAEVEKVISSDRKNIKSRVIMRLGKAYGHTAIPLLSASSVSAVWDACRSDFYRRQLALLHRWIQPFAESLHTENVGCDYVSSIEQFLRPKEQDKPDAMIQFYSWFMAFATEFNLVALLDNYVSPKPVVVELVRKQLLVEDEEQDVRQAIWNQIENRPLVQDEYRIWLSYSGIDFQSKSQGLVSIIKNSTLHRALFDLKLGHRVKSLQLGRYSEVHDARSIIESFFSEFKKLVRPVESSGLWWDGIDRTRTPPSPWTPEQLKLDPAFLVLLEIWIRDSIHLQESLDYLEWETRIVNNPHHFNQPVFSEAIAATFIEFMKLAAQVLDERRERCFAKASNLLKREGERLGLFKTRLPRFSQLFFYEFDDLEVAMNSGQVFTSKASKRGAEAYLRSGIRLESKCGISDVWYHYVETNRVLFEDTSSPHPTPQSATPTRPHSRLDARHVPAMCNTFRWKEQHSRLSPQELVLQSSTNSAPEQGLFEIGVDETSVVQGATGERNAAGDTVGDGERGVQGVAEEDEYQFSDDPLTDNLFSKELGDLLDQPLSIPHPSSVLKERDSHDDSSPLQDGETTMEGIRAGQPDDGPAADADGEIGVQDVEYQADPYPMAGKGATKAQRNEALRLLKERREAKLCD